MYSRFSDDKSLEERLYMNVESGGRGLLSFEYIYNMAKIRISNYLSHTEDPRIQTVFNREQAKTNSKSVTRQAEVAFQDVVMKVKFDHNKIQVNGEDVNGNHKQTARKLKTLYQNEYQERLEKTYKEKKVQSKIWSEHHRKRKKHREFQVDQTEQDTRKNRTDHQDKEADGTNKNIPLNAR